MLRLRPLIIDNSMPFSEVPSRGVGSAVQLRLRRQRGALLDGGARRGLLRVRRGHARLGAPRHAIGAHTESPLVCAQQSRCAPENAAENSFRRTAVVVVIDG